MKILTIQVDVTSLSENEIDDLRYAMEVQCEDSHEGSEDAEVLRWSVKDINLDKEDTDETH